jgi:hypothetical protein
MKTHHPYLWICHSPVEVLTKFLDIPEIGNFGDDRHTKQSRKIMQGEPSFQSVVLVEPDEIFSLAWLVLDRKLVETPNDQS